MASTQTFAVTVPYVHTSCELGEAPFWRSRSNTLRFVDIHGQKIFSIDLQKGPQSLEKWDLPFSVGSTADLEGEDDWVIFGGQRGYGLLNTATKEHFWLKHMWTDAERLDDGGGKPGVGRNREARMRSNDGAVDARGRYFMGTMNHPVVVGDKITDEGVLFRLDPDLTLHRVKEGLSIPNGISWSQDNKTVYFTDSPSGEIRAYPYNIETGEISWAKGQPFFKTPYEGSVPDGHCQDVEGYHWVALHCAGRVVRVDSKGKIVAEVIVPTRGVTCPAFAGTQLFITSAQEPEPETHPASVEFGGALFAVDVNVRGKTLNKFKLPFDIATLRRDCSSLNP